MADKQPATLDAWGSCPVPIGTHTEVLLGHGSGGKLTADLV